MTLLRKIKLTVYSIVLCFAIYYWYQVTFASTDTHTSIAIAISDEPEDTLHLKEALAYCDSLGYNSEFAILINLAPHSGNYRLFVFNLETKDTLFKGLVAHGHCQTTDNRFAQFSNELGSNCSSYGHYRVGGKYDGSFGTSYKLIGKDSSNSNALNRYVVLHAHECIPTEPREDDICHSEGCPTIAPALLQNLIPYIDTSRKPILLWIYN